MGTFLRTRGLSVVCLLAASAAYACGGTDDVNDNGGSGAAAATGGDDAGSGGADSGDGGSDTMSGGMGGEGTGGDGTGGDGTGGAPVVLEKSNKIDVLFVVDNSVSMDDEHKHLIPSAKRLFENLANPPCTSDTGEQVVSTNGNCPDGYTIAFAPRRDMHVGVITTSIGGRGSDQCAMGDPNYYFDDRSYLIPKVRAGIADPNENGILSWKGGTPEALLEMSDQLGDHLAAAGTSGCGFEAPLESMYRFLVDPSPDESMELKDNGRAESSGIDQEILEQRAEFLRPDSALIVVVLSDEDDCSMMAGGNYYNNAGFGYLTAKTTQSSTNNNPFLFPVATEVCESDPNDKCCFSCLQAGSPPKGCEAATEICGETLPVEDDRANVRCFDQKRRFGVDLLYPVERYVDGLSELTIIDSQTAEEVKNPLFHNADGDQTRDPNWVYLLSIVGVPWQDLATQESLKDANKLEYLNAKQLSADNLSTDQGMVSRWDAMVGDRSQNILPFDPFMIASIDERSGDSPIIVDGSPVASIVPSGSAGWNAINGHEANFRAVSPMFQGQPANDDLQYACIYTRTTPITGCTIDDASCDCGGEPLHNRPVCSNDQDAATPGVANQYYGKGYPGLRELSVVRGLGERGVPGSICPKIIDPAEEDGAYHPAVDALLERLGSVLE